MANLEHFAIYAADAPGLKDFYVSAFGLSVAVESGGNPPAYFLNDGRGTSLEIIGRPSGEVPANQRWVCHLAFWADDYEAQRERLRGLGVVFETDTAVQTETMRTEFFNDPAGNRCQIVWRSRRLGS